MAKNLNVNLSFTAQTGQAKAQIQELQTLLNKIAYSGNTTINVNPGQIQQAAAAAKQLQQHLNNAYNATTGNIDLSRLDKSLKSAQTNIGALSQKLLAAGDTGKQAFAALAQSIAKADQPMLRLGGRMNEFLTTLKNTARWQFSSSMIHGAMKTIQSAYGYAQDLNESLNNIRIVTGQSIEEMAQFAEQANKAAKALSTTTTAYTDAALIYYQQGLSGQEVIERTDATTKMANVSRQSVEEVSNQMTAIWNNFADGSKSLEYYGDVITALGAKTASSSEEIATGLEKFASIAETVGLSYEYATAALATVTATTRQSADTVGTAFKTLFARLQGLQLGETLEDGVTLNKYSEALAKVGVEAVDANGNLVEMDTILEQLGQRWETLTNAEQTALAQTVAGVRQYTQLMALMENWDYFKENLGTAYDAEGTLSEQAEIYAESWEAASKRVKASAESIWQNLLDDKFFIGINNGFAQILGGIGEFVQGIGGMKGVIISISSLILANFANKIPDAIRNLQVSFTYLTKGAGDAYLKLQTDFAKVSESLFAKGGRFEGQKDTSFGFLVTSSNELAAARTMAAEATKNMSNAEKMALQSSLDLASAQQDSAYQAKVKVEELTEAYERQKTMMMSTADESIINSVYNNISASVDKAMANVPNLGKSITPLLSDTYALKDSLEQVGTAFSKQIISKFDELKGKGSFTMEFKSLGEDAVKVTNEINNLKNALQNINKAGAPSFTEIKTNLIGLIESLPPGIREVFKLDNALRSIKGIDPSAQDSVVQLKKVFLDLENSLGKNVEVKLSRIQSLLRGIHDPGNVKELISIFESMGMSAKDAEAKVKELQNNLQGLNFNHAISGLETLAASAALFGNISMGLRSIQNIVTTMENQDIGGFEKLTSVLMSISMLIPAITMGYNNFTKIKGAFSAAVAKSTALMAAEYAMNITSLSGLEQTAKGEIKSALATYMRGKATKEATQEKLAEILVTQAGFAPANAEMTASRMIASAKYQEAAAHKAAGKAKLASLGAYAAIAAIIAVVIALIAKEIVTQKEAIEAVSEVNNAYEEEKKKLEELKNELEDISNKIDELNQKETLSLVEQEELSKLKETEASLKRQVALQEKLAELAQKKASNAFQENAKSLSRWAKDFEIPDDSLVDLYVGGTDEIFSYLGDYYLKGNYDQQMKQLYSLLDEGIISDNNFKILSEEIQASQDRRDAELAEWRIKNQDAYNEYLEGYANYYAQHGQDAAYKNQTQSYIAQIEQMQRAMYGSEYETEVLGSMRELLSDSEAQKGNDILQSIISDAATTEQDVIDMFSTAFKNQLAESGISESTYANYLLDQASRIESGVLSKFEGNEDYEEIAALSGEDLEIMTHLNITGEESLEEVTGLIDEYKNSELNIETSTPLQDFAKIHNLTKDLKIGDTISSGDYASLIEQVGSGIEDFFAITVDGEYELIENAEKFKSIVNDIGIEGLLNTIKNNKDQIATNQAYANNVNELGINLDNVGVSAYGAGATSNYELTENQFALLEAMGKDTGQLRTNLENASSTYELETAYQAVAEAAAAAKAEFEAFGLTESGLLGENAQLASALASTAKTLDELDDYAALTQDSSVYDKYFDSTFQKEVEAEGFDVATLEAYAEALQSIHGEEQVSEQEAKRLALAHNKLNRGLTNLTDNWEEWESKLKSDSLIEQSEAISGIKDSLADILGVDLDQISNSFIQNANTQELMKKAAQGNKEAIDQLAESFVDFKAASIDINNTEFEKSLEGLQTEVGNYIDLIQEQIANNELIVGMSLDSSGFASAMTDIMAAAGTDIDTINSILAGLGFEPEVSYVEIPVDQYSSMINSGTTTWRDSEGNSYTAVLDTSLQANESGMVKVPVINGSKTTFKGAPSSSASSKKSGGGGGGGGKTPERKRMSSDDRYKEVTDAIDNLTESLTDLNRELDIAYGKGRIAAMDKILDQLEKEEELIREKISLVQKYRNIDKSTLLNTMAGTDAEYDSLSDFGVQDFVIDEETGDITNWTAVWESWYAKRDALMDELEGKNGFEAATGSRKTEIEEQITKMDEFEEKLREDAEQYMESNELFEEEVQKLKDLIVEQMEMRYDSWEEELKLREEINNDFIDRLERTLKYFNDSFFARAEKFAVLLNNSLGVYNTGDAGVWQSELKELEDLYAANKITQADFIEGTKYIQQYAENAIDQLYDYKEEMSNYYKETIEESLDIFNGVMDQFDHMQTVLDHYENIYEILEGTYDYDTQIDILEARAEVLANETAAAESAYAMYSDQLKEQEKEFLAAKEVLDSIEDKESIEYQNALDAYNETKNSYEAALAAAQETRETLLATAEEWAQTLRDIFNTELEKFGKELEKKALSGLDNIYSFDQLNDSIENAKSLTEEWLTTTNKIYETNKLINTAQKDIDNTSNAIAKNKLQAFINETQQLQNQAKLSNFELEVQQAKYNLLLAEIALEEAQNAKSVVRMQRDSEGNFGYVYTADTDAVGEAEQEYADAENDLYNIRLEGANDFAEKRMQAEQDMIEQLQELNRLYYQEQSITDEEYNARKAQIIETYGQLIQDYSYLYNEAVRYDTRVTADAWSTQFEGMVTDTESWKDNVNDYLGNVEEAWSDFKESTVELNRLINVSTGEVATNIKENLNKALEEAKTNSQLLSEYTTSTLIPALDDEITKVDELAAEFRTDLIPQINEAIRAYEKLADAALASRQEAYDDQQVIDPEIPAPAPGGEGATPGGDGNNNGGENNNNNLGSKTWSYSLYDNGEVIDSGSGYQSEDAARKVAGPKLNAYGYGSTYKILGNSTKGYGYSIFNSRNDWLYQRNTGTFSSKALAEEAAKKQIGIFLGLPQGYLFSVAQMNTGGYTGSWGPEGKLAMLHQKELVLNATDTDNMLKTVSFVRDIIQKIDLRASTWPMHPSLAVNSLGDTNSTIEQQVTIEANFPAATDRYEIEIALKNLMNTASQFANRKKL